MKNSRRNFCRNAAYISLGLGVFPMVTQAKTSVKQNSLCLKKNGLETIKISGKICHEDHSPVKNTVLEIWHNNSENNSLGFEYDGKLVTDDAGNYHFETDFPALHFEAGAYKMRRIFLKIKQSNGQETLTKLYLGANKKAYVDGFHVANTPQKHRLELPKTKHENDALTSIQFNIYLNS